MKKSKIDRSQEDSFCKPSKKVGKNIDHIINDCSKHVQKEQNKSREKWEHDNLNLSDNKGYKKNFLRFQYFVKQNNRIIVMQSHRQDLVVLFKKIDSAVPGDSKIEDRET